MGLGEGIRECVADVGVQTADINSGAITNQKLNPAVGTVHRGVLTGSATSGYVTLVAVTTAATFYFGLVQVTAQGTSGGVSLVNSAGSATLISEIACSAAVRSYTNFDTAINTTKVIEIAAGGTLCALYTTGTATANFRAKYFVMCVSTPS